MFFKKILKSILMPAKQSGRLRDNGAYCDCTQTVDTLLKHYKPKILFDIGAHNGDWSQIVLESLHEDITIALFEPQKIHFSEIVKLFNNKKNKYLFNLALGNSSCTSHIKGGGASASLLDASDLQNSTFPGSFDVDKLEEVEVLTLDEVIAKNHLVSPDVIKIDVQGFELDVFKGAVKTLPGVKYIVAELSFIHLYKNQPSLTELLQFLEKNNFVIVDFGYQWRNEKNELIQVDAIFKNSN